MISYHTALGLGQVSATYLGPSREGLPATVDRLRIHRQLAEAVANRADPLHLAEVFGIHAATAVKYANNARQLLESPIENNTTS